MVKTGRILSVCILAALMLTTCGDSAEDSLGTLAVTIGGGSSRGVGIAWANGLDSDLVTHEVTVTDRNSEAQTTTIPPGGGTASFSGLSTGSCRIYVQGTYNGRVVSVGSMSVTVHPGRNGPFSVTMGNPAPPAPGTPGVPIIYSVADIAPYLNSQSGGNSAANPVPLRLALELTDDNWGDILNAIDTVVKYVNLDLSKCTRPSVWVDDGFGNIIITNGGIQYNGAFDPNYTSSTGKDKIVALVLPDAATGIASLPSSAYNEGIFEHFDSLVSFSALNVTSIPAAMFYSCGMVTSVSFPNATTIEGSVNNGGGTVGPFANCLLLSSLYIPKITTIGNQGFRAVGTTHLTITMGATAPSLGNDLFQDAGAKSVTVRVPTGATGYDANWEIDFKTGTAATITLVIQEF